MKKNIKKLVRREVINLKPYETADRNLPILLDALENPYGCSSKVNKALKNVSNLNRYPIGEYSELRNAISKYLKIRPKQVIAGNGSDEIISLIVKTFISQKERMIIPYPTFAMYEFYTKLMGGNVILIPLDENFTLKPEQILSKVNDKTKLIILCQPNNPTGNFILSYKDLYRVIEEVDCIVVVDEAYAEFSGKSVVEKINKYDNLRFTRTFSKAFGLAGLRIGYAVSQEKIIQNLLKVKSPYNLDRVAQIAAIAALNDLEFMRNSVNNIIKERNRLLQELKKINNIKVFPSVTNFILFRIDNKLGKKIADDLRRSGIAVRYFDSEILKNFLRVSMGLPEENDKFIVALKKVLK